MSRLPFLRLDERRDGDGRGEGITTGDARQQKDLATPPKQAMNINASKKVEARQQLPSPKLTCISRGSV
jgi:hypothetical protein